MAIPLASKNRASTSSQTLKLLNMLCQTDKFRWSLDHQYTGFASCSTNIEIIQSILVDIRHCYFRAGISFVGIKFWLLYLRSYFQYASIAFRLNAHITKKLFFGWGKIIELEIRGPSLVNSNTLLISQFLIT